LRTASTIIDYIGTDELATLNELTTQLDLSKSTIHYYLRTLESARYIVNTSNGYRLGLRCLELGGRALDQHGFERVISTEIDQLAEETQKTAIVAVEEGGKSVVVYRAWPVGGKSLDCRLGAEHYLHTTAFGKAILSYLPEEDVESILDHYGLPAETENTITDREALFEERETTRTKEVAFDDGEHREQVRSIAAPILWENESIYGAIGIIGPADEIDDPFVHSKAKRFEESPSNIVKRYSHTIGNKLEENE
jgi:DNA-binding IclR family transcriptional regulator